MRRRSNTIYAENVAEFTEKANDTLAASTRARKPNIKKKINASSLLPILFTEDHKREDFKGTAPNTAEKDSQYWSEFDFDMDKPNAILNTKSESMIKDDLCCTDSTEDTMCSSPDSMRRCVTRKFMVIGMCGTGRHSLVNSIFDSQGKQGQSSLRQTMDLIIKTKKEATCEAKYQFWLKALNDNKFDGLVKVYYRIASVFFFVYSVTDRDSFEKLNEAIEAVMKEVPREKFVGVLLGNKCDLEEQRQVDFSEGVTLKEKYNLSFLETSLGDKSKDQLFSFLKNQA